MSVSEVKIMPDTGVGLVGRSEGEGGGSERRSQ